MTENDNAQEQAAADVTGAVLDNSNPADNEQGLIDDDASRPTDYGTRDTCSALSLAEPSFRPSVARDRDGATTAKCHYLGIEKADRDWDRCNKTPTTTAKHEYIPLQCTPTGIRFGIQPASPTTSTVTAITNFASNPATKQRRGGICIVVNSYDYDKDTTSSDNTSTDDEEDSRRAGDIDGDCCCCQECRAGNDDEDEDELSTNIDTSMIELSGTKTDADPTRITAANPSGAGCAAARKSMRHPKHHHKSVRRVQLNGGSGSRRRSGRGVRRKVPLIKRVFAFHKRRRYNEEEEVNQDAGGRRFNRNDPYGGEANENVVAHSKKGWWVLPSSTHPSHIVH